MQTKTQQQHHLIYIREQWVHSIVIRDEVPNERNCQMIVIPGDCIPATHSWYDVYCTFFLFFFSQFICKSTNSSCNSWIAIFFLLELPCSISNEVQSNTIYFDCLRVFFSPLSSTLSFYRFCIVHIFLFSK